jgi:hypothetical protein
VIIGARRLKKEALSCRWIAIWAEGLFRGPAGRGRCRAPNPFPLRTGACQTRTLAALERKYKSSVAYVYSWTATCISPAMRDLLASATHAIRVLRRNPAFTLSALAVLTLGIGANTAIFGVVNAVLLKPLPFPDSDSIVTVFHVPPPAAFPGIKRFSVSPAIILTGGRRTMSSNRCP